MTIEHTTRQNNGGNYHQEVSRLEPRHLEHTCHDSPAPGHPDVNVSYHRAGLACAEHQLSQDRP